MLNKVSNLDVVAPGLGDWELRGVVLALVEELGCKVVPAGTRL